MYLYSAGIVQGNAFRLLGEVRIAKGKILEGI
jgi:hypothetical protein